MKVEALLGRVDRLLAGGGRVLLGVAGAPAGGKTTLAADLVAAVNARPPGDVAVAVQVPMDGFHLADVQLSRLVRRARKGAPDTFDADGYAALLRRLRDNRDEVVYAPGFERDLEQALAGAIAVPRSARLVVTEGNYLLLPDPEWTRVRALLDEVWFVSVPDVVRRERLLARHVAFGKSPDDAAAWVAAVDDPNAVLVERHRDTADLLVDLSD